MSYVLKIEAVVGELAVANEDPIGQYVAEYDPDRYEGQGYVRGVLDAAEALRFATPGEALIFVHQVSKVRPTRADGLPNRPLTTFAVSLVPFGEG